MSGAHSVSGILRGVLFRLKGTWRGVSFRAKGKCAVFYSVFRAPGAVFHSDTNARHTVDPRHLIGDEIFYTSIIV